MHFYPHIPYLLLINFIMLSDLQGRPSLMCLSRNPIPRRIHRHGCALKMDLREALGILFGVVPDQGR